MVKTNREKLLEIGVIGAITHPAIDARYVNNWDGKPSVGLGQGGIVYNIKPGDSCFDWAWGEKVEPGVSVDGIGNDRAKGSFRNFTCVGNKARVVKGEAKGKEGVVVGKVGGLPDRKHHVVVYFEEDVLEMLSIGDKIQVRSAGIGLRFTEHPSIRSIGVSPELLDSMGFKELNGRLGVPVTTVIPADFVGMGSGGAPVESSCWNVMTQSPDALEHLKDVKIGDIVALKDILSSWGRGYYENAYTIGVVSTGASGKLGQGISVTSLMTCKEGEIESILVPDANIGKYFKLGGA
jgi:Domain of unknown function (DUF4438), N-terminal/Domain of unknown function (DUF4438), C-terminal